MIFSCSCSASNWSRKERLLAGVEEHEGRLERSWLVSRGDEGADDERELEYLRAKFSDCAVVEVSSNKEVCDAVLRRPPDEKGAS